MKISFLSCLAAIALYSCTTSAFIQHTPTLANTGMHRSKGEFNGNFYYSTGSSSANSYEIGDGASPHQSVNGIQAQGSFALTPFLALQASYMNSDEKGGSKENGTKNIVYSYKRNITETGIAYFKSLSGDNNLFVELGLGAGFGQYRANELNSLLVPGGRYYDHNVSKIYFQPSVYFISKNVHLGSGIKMYSLNFNDIKTDYTRQERESRQLPIDNNLSTFNFEVFLKTDFFLNNMPQLGFSLQALLANSGGEQFSGNLNDSNFGIGLRFRLGKEKMTGKD
ncbi:MAG TPA: hypothetical protein VFV31_01230 [Chitinophagaceae bacterium]|nr:hypothetical protein [Chitinophagaceae bacterium]